MSLYSLYSILFLTFTVVLVIVFFICFVLQRYKTISLFCDVILAVSDCLPPPGHSSA